MNACDMAIEILQKTHDGNDLAPVHLSIVQTAVNGWLSEEGEIEFYRLHRQVLEGYKKPWLHGIEHLTIDHTGYVYWRGRDIEHYSLRFAYSEEGKAAALELAGRCRHLELIGVEVSTLNAIWKWEDYQEKVRQGG